MFNVQFRGHILYINTKHFYNFQDGNFYSNHSFSTMFEHIWHQRNLGRRLMIDFIIISSHLQLYGLRGERSAELLTDHHIVIHSWTSGSARCQLAWHSEIYYRASGKRPDPRHLQHPSKKVEFQQHTEGCFGAVLVDVPPQHFVEVWDSAFGFAN